MMTAMVYEMTTMVAPHSKLFRAGWKLRLLNVSRAQYEFMTRHAITLGEPVSQDVHARQTYQHLRSVREDWPDLMWAGLFHDAMHGHWDPNAVHLDDHHQHYGAEVARALGAPEHVYEPIRYHVDAKRYERASAETLDYLTPSSEASLRLQGGPMSSEECRAFEKNPYFEASLELRLADDAGKLLKPRELVCWNEIYEDACK